MAHIEDIGIRFQVYLEGLKKTNSKEYNKVMSLLYSTVTEQLNGREISELSKTQLEKLIRIIKEEQGSNISDSVDTLINELQDLAVYAYEFEAGAIVAGTSVDSVPEDVAVDEIWKVATDRPLSVDGGLLDAWIDKLSETQLTSVENMLRRASAEGWSTRAMLQALRGTRANRYLDGLTYKLGRSNETIVRTVTQHISSTARQQVWMDNDDIISGYKWVSTLDNRTSSICRSLDGKKFDLDKGPLPPIHPNCRSVTVPILKDGIELLSKGATRSSATGSVPQTQTYYDWLKQQPAGFQDSVIGEERGLLLRNGGLSTTEFASLQLNSTFEPLTLDEMRRLKPLAFSRAGI